MIHNAIIRQSFRSRRGSFSCPLAVASFENAFQKPRVDGTAGARRTEGWRTRRKSRSFVTPERRRRAVRGETRGFEWVKNTFNRRASSHRRARRRRASNPSRVPSSSAFPRKDEARSASQSQIASSSSSSPYLSCCQTPTQEYVVPKSMPTAGPSALLMFVFVCVVTKNVRRNLSSTLEAFRAATTNVERDARVCAQYRRITTHRFVHHPPAADARFDGRGRSFDCLVNIRTFGQLEPYV